MVLLGVGVTIGSQQVDLQVLVLLLDGLDLQLALELDIEHVDVDVVVLELAEDVEVGVVTTIGQVRVESTRGVQGEAVGVDVKATRDLTADHVDVLAQCTGSALLAVAVTVQDFDADFVGQVVDGVAVERVTLDTAGLVPSRVVHQRQRGVERALVGTTRDAHCMVLHDVAVEQQVEPVGVHELGLTQIVVHGGTSVGQTELAVGGVVLVHQVIHTTVDTRRRTVDQRSELQPTLLLHLLEDAHLLLRVADVEVAIVGLQTIGELTGVVDLGVALATGLGGDHNHTSVSLCTVDRGSRTILQDLEALDIIGVQASHSRSNQCVGVTRRQVIGTHLNVVRQNHTVDHPKRLGVAID